ncbi:hypothetical protein QS257_13970 [Terrilactibacillus sp. S3-3]|nr:hypothetical protein QS257_13970 [Terrilactibacillus sp. S3-3]
MSAGGNIQRTIHRDNEERQEFGRRSHSLAEDEDTLDIPTFLRNRNRRRH